MKTYFYSVAEIKCGEECTYRTCPRRYFSRLIDETCAGKIKTFTGDERVKGTAPAAYPRHGDIIILYAQNRNDLEEIITAKENFEGLRRILVVGEPDGIDDSKYHKLAPRFITQSERSLTEVEAVINKMMKNAY